MKQRLLDRGFSGPTATVKYAQWVRLTEEAAERSSKGLKPTRAWLEALEANSRTDRKPACPACSACPACPAQS